MCGILTFDNVCCSRNLVSFLRGSQLVECDLQVGEHSRTTEESSSTDSTGAHGSSETGAGGSLGGSGGRVGGASRSGNTAGEIGVLIHGAIESGIGFAGVLGIRSGSGVGGVENAIDDVHNAVGNKDVGDGDAGRVDKDIAVNDGNGDLSTVESGESHVHESVAVANSAVDNVVGEDVGQVLHGEVANKVTDGAEGLVVGNEDGDIGEAINSLGELSAGEGTDSSGEVGLNSSGGDVLGNDQDAIDDVDDTAGEVNWVAGHIGH